MGTPRHVDDAPAALRGPRPQTSRRHAGAPTTSASPTARTRGRHVRTAALTTGAAVLAAGTLTAAASVSGAPSSAELDSPRTVPVATSVPLVGAPPHPGDGTPVGDVAGAVQQVTDVRPPPPDPRATAQALLAERGLGEEQWSCLEQLWEKESDWQVDADNPTSSAYGIPQALPGEKMASAGADWRTNPETQVRWGVQYVADVYGTPCAAWEHSVATDWY